MDDMPRAKFLAGAKARALEYLPDRPAMAINSITSDLTKHRETRDQAAGDAERLMRIYLARQPGAADALATAIEAIE